MLSVDNFVILSCSFVLWIGVVNILLYRGIVGVAWPVWTSTASGVWLGLCQAVVPSVAFLPPRRYVSPKWAPQQNGFSRSCPCMSDHVTVGTFLFISSECEDICSSLVPYSKRSYNWRICHINRSMQFNY